jgi:dihydrofolate reductase
LKLSIIVAVADNHVIGRDNQLIWHLPKDLKQFKNLTTGHPIIMGRKTFESIGKPLPNRTSIIISRNTDFVAEGCVVVNSLADAIAEAQKIESQEAFIIGGAEIYKIAMPISDKIYLTRVYHNFEGDTFFPEIDLNNWQETKREMNEIDDKHLYEFDFVELDRK